MCSLTLLNYGLRDLRLEKRKGGVCKQNRVNVDNACIHSTIQKVFAADCLCILKQIMLLSQAKLVGWLYFCSLWSFKQANKTPKRPIVEKQQQDITSKLRCLQIKNERQST